MAQEMVRRPTYAEESENLRENLGQITQLDYGGPDNLDNDSRSRTSLNQTPTIEGIKRFVPMSQKKFPDIKEE